MHQPATASSSPQSCLLSHTLPLMSADERSYFCGATPKKTRLLTKPGVATPFSTASVPPRRIETNNATLNSVGRIMCGPQRYQGSISEYQRWSWLIPRAKQRTKTSNPNLPRRRSFSNRLSKPATDSHSQAWTHWRSTTAFITAFIPFRRMTLRIKGGGKLGNRHAAEFQVRWRIVNYPLRVFVICFPGLTPTPGLRLPIPRTSPHKMN